MKHPDKRLSPLSLVETYEFVNSSQKIELKDEDLQYLRQCKAYLDDKTQDGTQAYYGINTGFGSLCDVKISKEDTSRLQENLIKSHACGTGKAIPEEMVKIMLFLKIRNLQYGFSGVSEKVVQRLIYFYNQGLTPKVPSKGSLGASGDLAPLAHLSIPLLGMGTFLINGEEFKASEVLKKHGLEPLKLEAKEGLALLNGTQFMLSFAIYCAFHANRLMNLANEVAAISGEAFNVKIDPYLPYIHEIRPHQGQIESAKKLHEILSGSGIVMDEKEYVQDPYSFRCIPQVHGASKDALRHVMQVFNTELNSVTENPNIFVEEDLILSGGNFHGQTLALSLDYLSMACSELGNISERRTYKLMNGKRGLPEFLVANPGLNSGFMIVQYSAAALVSQNKQLCSPASGESITSSNGQEDHVSMGANAATKCYEIIDNLYSILGIELLCALQALEFRDVKKASQSSHTVLKSFRKQIPFVEEDVYMHEYIERAVEFLRNELN